MKKALCPPKLNQVSLLMLFVLSFLPTLKMNAQKVYYDSITKQKYVRVDVRQTYERVLAKGYETVEMLEYLGSYYFDNRDYKKSKLYLDRLFKKYKRSSISDRSVELYNSLVPQCIN